MAVNKLEAGDQLSRLIQAAHAGGDVVMASDQAPAPLDWLTAHPLPAHLKRDHEAIEAGIQAEHQAWDDNA